MTSGWSWDTDTIVVSQKAPFDCRVVVAQGSHGAARVYSEYCVRDSCPMDAFLKLQFQTWNSLKGPGCMARPPGAGNIPIVLG